jgi:hypothetical protein
MGFGAAGGGGAFLGTTRGGGSLAMTTGFGGVALGIAFTGPVGVISVGRAAGRVTFIAATSDG